MLVSLISYVHGIHPIVASSHQSTIVYLILCQLNSEFHKAAHCCLSSILMPDLLTSILLCILSLLMTKSGINLFIIFMILKVYNLMQIYYFSGACQLSFNVNKCVVLQCKTSTFLICLITSIIKNELSKIKEHLIFTAICRIFIMKLLQPKPTSHLAY